MSRWAALWWWRSRMSERLRCRSSVPCPRRFWFAMACRVEWTVSGRIRRGGRCPEACPIGVSIVDAGYDRADIGRGPGLRMLRHRAWGAGGHDGRVPMLVAAGVAEGSMHIAVLSGQGQDVQAAWLAVAGWPDAWSDARRWRCPPLGRRRPDRVQTHRRGGHLELGMSGRPDAGGVRHVRHPASRCRVSGGTDRRRLCPGECPAAGPWRKRAARRTAGMFGTPWRSP